MDDKGGSGPKLPIFSYVINMLEKYNAQEW